MRIVPKDWGREIIRVNNELYCLKELHITPGWQCSLHRHLTKDETFLHVTGEVFLQTGYSGGIFRRVGNGERIRIHPRTWHRFASPTGGMLLEVSTHHDDADVERVPGEETRPLSPEQMRELLGELGIEVAGVAG